MNEAAVLKAMMAHSRQILLATDHTKFHASAAVEIGNISQITALFSDKTPPASINQMLKNHQIEMNHIAVEQVASDASV